MSSPAAVRGRAVRQRLLAAAVELVPERGWSAVSTRLLAERAGVTPSVVHYHFPSLSALLNEAAVGVMRQVLDDAGAVLDEASSPADAVELLLAAVDRYTGADPLSLLAVEAYLAATRDEELHDQIAGLLDGFRRRLERWLAEYEVPAPEVSAAVLAATIDGLLLHRRLTADPDTQHVASVLRKLVE